MGLDFIRSTAIPHKKAWREAYEQAEIDLFSAVCSLTEHVFIATGVGQLTARDGQSILIRLIDEHVGVFDGVHEIAVIDTPSAELRSQLSECYGILGGEVEEKNDLTNTLSIRVGGPRQ